MVSTTQELALLCILRSQVKWEVGAWRIQFTVTQADGVLAEVQTVCWGKGWGRCCKRGSLWAEPCGLNLDLIQHVIGCTIVRVMVAKYQCSCPENLGSLGTWRPSWPMFPFMVETLTWSRSKFKDTRLVIHLTDHSFICKYLLRTDCVSGTRLDEDPEIKLCVTDSKGAHVLKYIVLDTELEPKSPAASHSHQDLSQTRALSSSSTGTKLVELLSPPHLYRD